MDSFFWTNGGQPQPATFECDVRRTTRLATNPTDTKGSIIAIGLSGGMVSLSSLPKVVDGPATTGGAASLVVDDLLPGVAPAERRLLLDDDAFVVGGKRAVRAIATATATWRTGSAATAAAHSVAICQDGTAYSWGTGGNGRLGLGHTDTFAAPAPIKFGRDCRGAALVIADVRCGDAHTVATTDDGALYAWGEGFSGQTGHGAKRPTLVPRFVAALNAERAVSVACGSRFTIIATANGEVWTWGEGTCGQLGVARPRDVLLYFLQKHSPAMVDDAERILAEYAGREKKMWSGLEATYGEHPCTLYGASASASTKGSVKASARPVRALNATHRDAPFTSVAAGFAHALAMGGADGATLYSWGLNSRGQLGLGDFTARRLPTRVEHERTAPSFLDRIEVPAHCSRVAAAANYSAALFEGDELHTWGSGTAPLGHAAAAPSEAGSKPPPSVTRPRRVEMLRGIPVVMMHCLPDAMACVVVPAITELVPDAGNMHGGTRLQICGGGFFDSAEVEAVVNGTRGEEQSLLVRFAFPSVALAKKDADQGDESEGSRPASSGGAESAMQIAASEVIVNAVLMKNGRIACDVPALPEEIVEAVAGDVLSEIAAARAMLATVDVSCDGGASWTAERDACTTTGTHHFRYIGDQILKGVTPKTAIAAGGTVLTLNSVGFAAPPPELLEQDELIDEDGAMTPNAMVMQRKHEQSATRHAVATHSEGATVHFTSASGEVFHEPLRTVHTDTGATEVCVTCPVLPVESAAGEWYDVAASTNGTDFSPPVRIYVCAGQIDAIKPAVFDAHKRVAMTLSGASLATAFVAGADAKTSRATIPVEISCGEWTTIVNAEIHKMGTATCSIVLSELNGIPGFDEKRASGHAHVSVRCSIDEGQHFGDAVAIDIYAGKVHDITPISASAGDIITLSAAGHPWFFNAPDCTVRFDSKAMKHVTAGGTFVEENGTIVVQVPPLGAKPGRVKVELAMNGLNFIKAGTFDLEKGSNMNSPSSQDTPTPTPTPVGEE